MLITNSLEGEERTLPRLGSRVRIPSPAPIKSSGQAALSFSSSASLTRRALLSAAFPIGADERQGTSIALVGAYVLAGELAVHDDSAAAFESYERIARPFVEANQALATREGGSLFLPRTQQELDARNRLLAALASGGAPKMPNESSRAVYSALRLPDYERQLA
jgi:hypothetical protein